MTIPPNLAMVPRPASRVQYFPSVIPVQDTEPASTMMFWVDTSTAPPTLKGWNGAAWVAVGGGGGSAPDATASVKGIVQLAGDLGGTAASPTVPGLTSKVATTRTVSAGTGLTGGGDLSANRTLSLDLEYVQDQVATMLVAGSGVTLTYNDASGTLTVASSGGGGGGPAPLVLRSGEYLRASGTYANGTYSLSANTVTAVPILIPADTYQSITAVVTTAGASGSLLRLGIYDGDTLVKDYGTVASDTTGGKTIASSLTVAATKWYWAVVVHQGVTSTALSVARVDNPGAGGQAVFTSSDMQFSPGGSLTYGTTQSGALPATIPGSRSGANHGPAITLRKT
jgi:hypothetical protein